MKYRALRELYYPTDPEVIRRLQHGEHIDIARRGNKSAQVGDVVDDLPESSVPWMLAKGWIEPVVIKRKGVTDGS